MPGGVIQGVIDNGTSGPAALTGRQPVPITATPDGRLNVNALVSEVAETNRLLRKLIFGLETYLGQEFPDPD